MHYDKKKRVHRTGSSPRDLQNRLNSTNSLDNSNQMVVDLMMKVGVLTSELENFKLERPVIDHTKATSSAIYTDKEFNEELTKALSQELLNNTEVIKLKQEVDVLKLKLEAKDDKIYALELKIEAITTINEQSNKNIKPPQPSEEVVKLGKRPGIEEVIIDPTDGVELESHINIKEEIITDANNNMSDKLNKLKELLGS